MSDDYEAKNIAPADVVVHRDKVVARMTAVACALMTLFFGAVAIGSAIQGHVAGAVGVGVAAMVFLFIGLTRSVLRTIVTRDDLLIHWGLQAITVPLSSIRELRIRATGRQSLSEAMKEPGSPPIEILDLGPTRYAASLGPQAKGAFGHVLDLRWEDAKTGRTRRAWLGADDPDGLFAAIQRGRAGRKSVRIDTSSAPGDALSEAEAEAEAEAEEALSKAGAPPP